jgi:LDH2 family malate/lactate/ureidoglycolate dehydrogenase
LVPPKPNDDTVATRGPADAHGIGAVGTAKNSGAEAMSGWGADQLASGGMVFLCTASTAFISPAMPAADMVCPTFAFAEPIHTGLPRPASCAFSAPSSVRSPTVVPVPWVST